MPRGVVVHRGGEEGLAHGLAADAGQPFELFVLLPGRFGQGALAGELRVAQRGGRVQELLDLVAVFADEPVHRGRDRGRLAQRLDLFRGLALARLAQLARRRVARRGELRERQSVQLVDDLRDGHLLHGHGHS